MDDYTPESVKKGRDIINKISVQYGADKKGKTMTWEEYEANYGYWS